ncbi:MAG: hypothetical protein QXN68_00395 [Thermoplasmata archaeon]
MTPDELILKILLDVGVQGDKNLVSAAKSISEHFGSVSKLRKVLPALKSDLEKAYNEQTKGVEGAVDFSEAYSRLYSRYSDYGKKLAATVELINFKRQQEVKLARQILAIERARRYEELNRLRHMSRFVPVYFGLLFLGYRVSKLLNSILVQAYRSYSEVVGGIGNVSNAFFKIQASLHYIYFSFMDALSRSEFFQKVSDFLVTLLNSFADFVSAHPALSLSILIGGVVVSSLAVLTSWVAQIGLLILALQKAKYLGAISTSLAASADLFGIPSWLLAAFKVGAIVISVYFAADFSWDVFYNFGRKLGDVFRNQFYELRSWMYSFFINDTGNVFIEFSKRALSGIMLFVDTFKSILLSFGYVLSKIFGNTKQAEEIKAALKSTVEELKSFYVYLMTGDTSKLKDIFLGFSEISRGIEHTKLKVLELGNYSEMSKITISDLVSKISGAPKSTVFDLMIQKADEAISKTKLLQSELDKLTSKQYSVTVNVNSPLKTSGFLFTPLGG